MYKELINKDFVKEERGSITIEAAIILPIVIIIFLLFLSLMKMSYILGKMQLELNRICEEFTYDSYLIESLGLFDEVQDIYGRIGEETYSHEEVMSLANGDYKIDIQPIEFSITEPEKILDRGKELLGFIVEANEIGSQIKDTFRKEGVYFLTNMVGRTYFESKIEEVLENNEFEFFVTIEHLEMCVEEDSGTIIISYPYDVKAWLPILETVTLQNSCSLQLFSGHGDYNKKYQKAIETSAYGEGEKSQDIADDDGYLRKVYVTEKGEKYHKSMFCFHIKVLPIPVLKAKIGNTPICNKCEDLDTNGINAYVYKTKNGDVYHTVLTCPAIYHIRSDMSEKEALAKGYSPCGSCSR